MAQNEANPGSHADQPPDFEELRKQIAHARQQAQAHLGRGDASSWEEVSLGSVASMLARVEQALLDTKLAQTPPIKPVDTLPTGFASTSAPTSNSASGSTTTSSTQAPPPQSSALLLVPPATALSLYSEPAMPLERSVFFDLWRMWAFHARITTRNIPKLEGKFLDLYPIAMSIKSLGGEAEMNRNSNLWKQLAFRLRYIDDEGQNDERSKHVIEVLQKIQEEVFRPFEQYCIDWSRLSEAERKQRLGEWMEAWKRSKAKAPSPASEPEDTLSTIAPAPRGLLFPPAALEHNPILNIAEHPEDAGVKLVEFYFQHFYPGVPLYTKIDRLLKMPPTEATRHGWTRERLDWLLKFQRHHAGRDPVQVVASIAKSLPALMSQRSQASVGSLELPMAPVHKPADSGKPIVQSPPTKYTLFPTQLVFRANGFIEATISKIEDLRAKQKRIDVPESHRKQLKETVTEGYDVALFFYHTAALHYMLFLNEKNTQVLMMQAVMLLEQFFFSSTGYPVHIMTLEYARSAVGRLQNEIKFMKQVYAVRYQDYLNLKEEDQSRYSSRDL